MQYVLVNERSFRIAMALARASSRQGGEETETHSRILTAASEWFAGRGYAATSIRDIAGSVGVTAGAIYVHFASKDRLLVAVYEEGVRRICRAVDAALVPDGAPWERLEAAAAAHLKALLDNAAFARVIARVVPSDAPEAARDLRALRHGYEARFRELIAALEITPECDRTLLRLQLLGALNATQAWYKRGTGRSAPDRIAHHLVTALRDGVAGKGSTR
jgi:AcrR family transcriptional regulator